ncbi:uncharacterized protein LOC122253923 [Penaeus japonicus]|uniref:uncharacterized protein LOC122253923 n=1 Tax=Penaeus japonicus TaxID=27405 RepID=UPI001C70BBF3|nr:uncharacterized protein LOC122253923 [Penaeus japonicus]
MRGRSLLAAALALALVLEVAAVDPHEESAVEKQKRYLFGTVSTTTYSLVSVSTSTVYFSCLSGTFTQRVCQGRNAKRKRKSLVENVNDVQDAMLLDSSGGEKGAEPDPDFSQDDGDVERLGFTVWTTSKTTSTVTVIYTNTASTVKISYYCVAGGIRYPSVNC